MSDPKKTDLITKLRTRIDEVEAQHAMARQKDALPGGAGENKRWVGAPPSSFLGGGGYNDDADTALKAAKGRFVACARLAGGCGGVGYFGGDSGRSLCPLCNGVGKLASFAGLADLRSLLELLEPSRKPECSDEELEAFNAAAEQKREALEMQQREQQERLAKERAIYGEAQKKLDELRRGPADDPVVEHEIAKRVHEANKSREGA